MPPMPLSLLLLLLLLLLSLRLSFFVVAVVDNPGIPILGTWQKQKRGLRTTAPQCSLGKKGAPGAPTLEDNGAEMPVVLPVLEVPGATALRTIWRLVPILVLLPPCTPSCIPRQSTTYMVHWAVAVTVALAVAVAVAVTLAVAVTVQRQWQWQWQ